MIQSLAVLLPLGPSIRAVAVRFDTVEPRGTALGCTSNLTVTGGGYLALAMLQAMPADLGAGVDGAGAMVAGSDGAGAMVPSLTCGFGAAGSGVVCAFGTQRVGDAVRAGAVVGASGTLLPLVGSPNW